jgi:hypothetical protein
MSRTRRMLAAIVALTLFSGVACVRGQAGVAADWPRADSERAVPRPADQERWPLTGAVAPDATLTATPPVLVPVAKVGPGGRVTGLELADVVYELPLPAGATRLVGLYQSRLPAQAGPIAEASKPDDVLALQYGGVVAQPPAAGGTGTNDVPAAYITSGADTYVDVARLISGSPRRAVASGLLFGDVASEGGTATPVLGVTVPYTAQNKVSWEFGGGDYARSVNGAPHGPRGPYRAANVVVLWAKGSDVRTGGELLGAGRASVFSSGRGFAGRWEASQTAPPSIRAEDGSPIILAPGTTWFEVVPTSLNITLR